MLISLGVTLAVDNFLYCSNGNSCADSISVQAQLNPLVLGRPEDRRSLLQARSQLSGAWLWWESADPVTCGCWPAPGETEGVCVLWPPYFSLPGALGDKEQRCLGALIHSMSSTMQNWWKAGFLPDAVHEGVWTVCNGVPSKRNILKLGTHINQGHLNQVWNINTSFNNQQDVNCLSAGNTVVGDTKAPLQISSF